MIDFSTAAAEQVSNKGIISEILLL